jgi:hypothetical protein
MKRNATTLTLVAASLIPLVLTGQALTGQALTGQALAGQTGKISRQGRGWVEEFTATMPASQRVKVETPGGQVEIRGGNSSEIGYRVVKHVQARSEQEARQKFAAAVLEVRRTGERADFSLEQRSRHSEVGADFFLTVPKALLQAQGETAGGNVLIENIDGEAIAGTAGGDVRVDQIGGGAKLETAGGQMYLGTIHGRIVANTAGGNISLRDGQGDAVLETSGGNIVVESCTKTVRANSAGGNVEIRRCGGDVRVGTAGGSIRLGVINGIVVAETAGGGIEVESARAVVRAESAAGVIRLGRIAGPVRAETAAGNIFATVVADRASWAESQLGTQMGDVVVYLPANLAITIRATIEMAHSRQAIHSDFPLTFSNPGDWPGMRELIGEAQINGGGPQLKIRTTTGKIEIIKVSK